MGHPAAPLDGPHNARGQVTPLQMTPSQGPLSRSKTNTSNAPTILGRREGAEASAEDATKVGGGVGAGNTLPNLTGNLPPNQNGNPRGAVPAAIILPTSQRDDTLQNILPHTGIPPTPTNIETGGESDMRIDMVRDQQTEDQSQNITDQTQTDLTNLADGNQLTPGQSDNPLTRLGMALVGALNSFPIEKNDHKLVKFYT